MSTAEMDTVKPSTREAQPIKSLDELYNKLDNLTIWPEVVDLRETAEYVYKGSDVNDSSLNLEMFSRDYQPRTIVCHDMKGGYLEDRFIDGSNAHDSYTFYHWSVVDTFIYFSHYFVTIPPYGWINAAHNHGVKVLGTVITEGSSDTWERILESKESAKKFANALVTVTKLYKFEGWLLNIENKIKLPDIDNLIYFVTYLTDTIHKEIDHSEIIWYDSVTTAGELRWQNELNDKNKEFFLACDGIFLNYNWTESKLLSSYINAINYNRDVNDVYVGLDVWGRGCPGGGGFNSAHALQMIRTHHLSVAIFAPAWTHEYCGSTDFNQLENVFWALLYPHLYVHVPIYEDEPFQTSFCRGSGTIYSHSGQKLETPVVEGSKALTEHSFYNLTLQKPQLSVAMFTNLSVARLPKNKNNNSTADTTYVHILLNNVREVCQTVVDFVRNMAAPEINYIEFCNSFSYEGGGCLKLITKDIGAYHRLLLLHIEFNQEVQATVICKPQEVSAYPFASHYEPSLVLSNYISTSIIPPIETHNSGFGWTKFIYLTNTKTVKEIGLAFTMENECYLGEIIIEQKERRFVTGH